MRAAAEWSRCATLPVREDARAGLISGPCARFQTPVLCPGTIVRRPACGGGFARAPQKSVPGTFLRPRHLLTKKQNMKKILALSTACHKSVNREIYRILNKKGFELILLVPRQTYFNETLVSADPDNEKDLRIIFDELLFLTKL